MITDEQIREKLIKYISETGISQNSLAKKLAISHTAVQQYFTGRAMPSISTFANLCKILDLDPAEILCINEEEENSGKTIKVTSSFNNNSGNINFKS